MTTTEVPTIEERPIAPAIPASTTTDLETADGRDAERRRRAAEFGEF